MNMYNKKLYLIALLNAIGVFIYTAAIVWILFNGDKLFNKEPNFWIPVSVLLLFVLSATIVGLLVLGRPAYLYFNGAKKEGITLLLYTIGWLLVITIIVFLLQIKRLG